MGLNVDALYAGDNMNAAYVKDKGGFLNLEIMDVEAKSFESDDGTKQVKAVLHFKNEDKQLSLNVTNKNILRDSFGADTDGWIGKKITVRVYRTAYKGKPCDGLTIDEPKADNSRPMPPPQQPAPQASILGRNNADKMLNKLSERQLDINALRASLSSSGCAADIVNGDPSAWPTGWAKTIQEWIANPTSQPYVGVGDDEIPFHPQHYFI